MTYFDKVQAEAKENIERIPNLSDRELLELIASYVIRIHALILLIR